MAFRSLPVSLALLCVPALLAQAPAAAPAAPSPQVAYQGRLTEAGLPVTGTRSFTFALLDAQGNELWNSGAQDVAVVNGLYAVVLGGTGMPAIPASLLGTPSLKLRLTINGTALAPDTDLVPALQARSAFDFSGPLAGDVTGTQNATVVARLAGVPLDTTAPATGQALVFNGSSWAPATVVGTPGPQGPQGPAGPTGATGPAGASGPQGPMGLPGLAGPQGPAGATGPQGPAGASGRTLLNGTGAPAAALGADGDFYLDTAASLLYGPKGAVTAGTWPAAGVSLVGPQGPAGATGATGPAGATGATGPQGPQGLTGATGATGPQGIQGLQGPTGPQGPAGPAPAVITSMVLGQKQTGTVQAVGVTYIIALVGIFPPRSGSGSTGYSEQILGEIRMFAGNFPPDGWALCNGQLLSISSNTALFSILGTTYGGDGITTFALPDLRAAVPMHAN